MIVIADSGSTKTDWCWTSPGGERKTVQTDGLNPYFYNEDEILDILKKDLHPFLDSTKVTQVYFYGSGCGASNRQHVVTHALECFFTEADVDVYTDLLGAARALFQKNAGIACILGTGSSSCVYDGEQIVQQIPSLGYILGDEGSGAFLGRQFLTQYLRNECPATLSALFKKEYDLSLSEILERTYRQPAPNKFLASIVPFLVKNQADPFVKNMVLNTFELFYDNEISKYKDYQSLPLGVIGSIGFIFKDLLIESAKKHQINIQFIQQSPLDGLNEFHKEEIHQL